MIGLNRFLVAVATAAVAALTGAAYALIPSSNGVIHGCFKKAGGTLRVIDGDTATCAANELPLQWSQAGPPGAPGISGYEVVADVEDHGMATFLRGGFGASCPPGKRVLGGGAYIATASDTPIGEVSMSYPNDDGTGWRVLVRVDNATGEPFSTTVFATCAFVGE